MCSDFIIVMRAILYVSSFALLKFLTGFKITVLQGFLLMTSRAPEKLRSLGFCSPCGDQLDWEKRGPDLSNRQIDPGLSVTDPFKKICRIRIMTNYLKNISS
mgnify:CR=1 FL=1